MTKKKRSDEDLLSKSESETGQTEGFLRPELAVLTESSLIPAKNLIDPAPNQFTHELARNQPFFFDGGWKDREADGEFAQGDKVVLLVYHGGVFCRVVDGQGLYVKIEYDSLRKL